MGGRGATAGAVAAATFGITVAGLIGGYIGGWLIRRDGLKGGEGAAAGTVDRPAEAGSLLNTVIVVAIAMGAGSLVSAGIQALGVVLPVYIGSMIDRKSTRLNSSHAN